ncbi:MAG: glucose-1-phosphate thymidylyltransferase RfbA [Thermodesulfovibrionales bacterium]|nr:glucose-1-phosphate thymidylyltransferase RfbA [Thermodesulfovibrionales bacterium]
MKGIILAGGSGTRLHPATQVVNKHLLPIYNKPMIYYPLSTLMLMDVIDVLIICNKEDLEVYRKLFWDGSKMGINISYRIQEKPRGLAEGLLLAEDFVEDDDMCMILGDNIFFGHGLPDLLLETRRDLEKNGGAIIFAYWVHDPEKYGVVEFDEEENVLSLEEKPKHPKSNWVVTGLYFYNNKAVEIAKKIKPSHRGELEITSVNEEYLKRGELKVKLLGRGFAWFDAGTHDSFLEVSDFIATIEKKTGLLIGCIEEIAYRKGWMDKGQLVKLAQPLKKTGYGGYLLKIAEEKK